MANVKIKYIPWTDGSTTNAATLEEIFHAYPSAKYRLRRAFEGYGSCDQCGGELAETDSYFSLATDSPDDVRTFFGRQDGWDMWDEYFSDVWYNDSVGYLTDEQKQEIISTLIADGCDLELSRETVGDRHWMAGLTYVDSNGNEFWFCCPSCAEAYQAAHPGVQLRKVG